MKVFRTPIGSLGDLDSETVATVIATAVDIALVIDGDGVIREVVCLRADLMTELGGLESFVGKPWSETVTIESQPKVDALLRDAADRKSSNWRQVLHPSPRGVDIPILYAAVRTGQGGRCLALGRDPQPLASLQRRLVEAQMAMERDYSRLRHVEARYRILFQLSPEPVLMVDGTTEKVTEANPAALQLFGDSGARLIGRRLQDGFHRDSASAVFGLLSNARIAGHSGAVRIRLDDDHEGWNASATLFRQDKAPLFLIRFSRRSADATRGPLSRRQARLVSSIDAAPDGFVVTDMDGRIIVANSAFIEMAQLAGEEQARGALLERWVGRPGIDLTRLPDKSSATWFGAPFHHDSARRACVGH